MAFGENDIKMSSIGALAGSAKDLKLKELAKNVVSPWSKSKPHDGEYAANNDGEAYGVKLLSAATPAELYNLVQEEVSYYKLTNPITDSSKNIRLGDFRSFNYNNTYIPLGHLYEDGSNISLTEEGEGLRVDVIADCKYQNAVEKLDNIGYESTLISRGDLFNNYSTEFNRGVYFHANDGNNNYHYWFTGSLPYIGDLPFIDENNNEIKLDPVLDKDGWRSLIGESGNEIEVDAMEFISDVSKNSFGTNTALDEEKFKFYAIPDSIHRVKLTGEWSVNIVDPLNIYDGSLKITVGLKTSTANYSFSITYGKNNELLVDDMSIECKNIKSYLYDSKGTLLQTIEHDDMTISSNIDTPIYSGSYESSAIDGSSYVEVTWEANEKEYSKRIDGTTSQPASISINNAKFHPSTTGEGNAEIKFDIVVTGDQNTNYNVNCMITYDPLGVNSNNTVIYNERISMTTDANGTTTESISLTANLNALSPNTSTIYIQPSIEGQEGLFAETMVIFNELITVEE